MMNFNLRYLRKCRRSTVALLLLIVGTAVSARCALQVLPITFEEGLFRNGRPLSADGKVVVGRNSNVPMSRWTASTGLVSLPLPPNGTYWLDVSHLSFDGSVITGSGDLPASYAENAWTWKQSTGAVTTHNGNSAIDVYNLGVAPNGSFIVRVVESDTFATVYRDYPSGLSFLWAQGPAGSFAGVSEDGTILFGTAFYPSSQSVLPCYWTSSGQIVYGTAFVGELPSTPTLCSKDGHIIVGTTLTTIYIPVYGTATSTFRWDTTTNQVDYYLPSTLLTTNPSFVSPNGKIVEYSGWADPYHLVHGVLDSTTATEEAKGVQSVPSWLVNHNYLNSSDLTNRTHFLILGLSDNGGTVVGDFYGPDRHSFIAHRPVLGPASGPITVVETR